VTGLILALGAALVVVNYEHAVRRSAVSIRGLVRDRASAMGNRIAGKMEYLTASGDSALAELEIAGLGGTPDIRMALVADPSDTIRLSTEVDLLGRPLRSVLGPEFSADSPFRRSVLGRFVYTDSMITAVYPYRTPPAPGELRSSRTGVVVLSYDLLTPATRARREARLDSMVQGVVVLILCLLTWIGLHTLLTIPLKLLADGTRRLAHGESGEVLAHGGPSEIRNLTTSFNEMAAQVASRQRALERANRALRALSECRRELATAQDEQTLLDSACRVVVEQAGYRFAWVGYAEADELRRVTPVAHAGHEAGYLAEARVTWDDTELGRGPTGLAIRTGQPTVCQDILSDHRIDPWRNAQVSRGYGASAVVPLKEAGGRVFGALSVYASERGVFDDEEVKLLGEIAQELALGIEARRARRYQEEVERSLAANEAMLRQAQKMEAIGQLAGGVAHDFNNILGAIMMQASLAQGEPEASAELVEALGEIRHAAERGANLTRQLLLFSRKQVLQPRVLDLNEVVTSLARMLQRMLGEDVHMELVLHSSPLYTRADAGMIDQVLMNLAVNARDAMPGGGRLVIQTGLADLPPGESNSAEAPPGRRGRRGGGPGSMPRSGCQTRAPGFLRTSCPISSSRSSPPRLRGRAPAWGWPPPSVSCSSIAASCGCAARRGTEAPSRCCCPSPHRNRARPMTAVRGGPAGSRPSRSWWWKTTWWCGTSCVRRWSGRDTGSSRRPTGRRPCGSGRTGPGRSTCCSPIS
jgi:GAF domain-containing protein